MERVCLIERHEDALYAKISAAKSAKHHHFSNVISVMVGSSFVEGS